MFTFFFMKKFVNSQDFLQKCQYGGCQQRRPVDDLHPEFFRQSSADDLSGGVTPVESAQHPALVNLRPGEPG